MRHLVEALCSERCAGRAPGTPGGRAGREVVAEAMRQAGLTPVEQPVPGCGGANILAALPGPTDRWVVVAAHHDHLGRHGANTYWGADDNAAAVAILVEVGRALAGARPAGRGVLLAAFDGEEAPHFLSESMGSEHWAAHPTVPLDRVDLMLCMDLVGHSLGEAPFPAAVRNTLFALGAERSAGTGAHLDALAEAEPGVVLRRVDAETVPPLSDYQAFWQRQIPFVFLTAGRWRYYHTPQDTPDRLDYPKMAATARWLTRFVRESCARPEARLEFRDQPDESSTLRTLVALTSALAPLSADAAGARALAEALLGRCDAQGRLPEAEREQVRALVGALESRLA